jgi:sulfur carrier protein
VSVDATATYADLIAEIGYSPQAVSVLVDGSPVPEDQPVAVETVRVVRLIKGG